MMRSATLLFVMFMSILSVNATSKNYYWQNTLNLLPPIGNRDHNFSGLENHREVYDNRLRRDSNALLREHNAYVEICDTTWQTRIRRRRMDDNPSETEKKLMKCMKYLTNFTKITNLILPGFLMLDKAFIMTIVQFLQKRILNGYDCEITNYIILITNSILILCQRVMMEEHGEMWYELNAEKLLPVTITQTCLVIALPIFLEYPRYTDPKEPDALEPEYCSCGFLSFFALTVANDIMPAFTQLNFFIPLLIGSLFQHFDREGMWLLLFANITAFSLFQNSVLDPSQVVTTIVLLVIKLGWALYSKKEYFDIFSGFI